MDSSPIDPASPPGDSSAIENQPVRSSASDEGGKSKTENPLTNRPRTGKVARLPKVIRDKINTMILDGVPYADILTTLGEVAKHVTEHNITSWATGGYLDWLREQRRLEETRVKQEVAMDLACPDGGSRIHEGTLQLAATSLSEMVRKFDYSHFQELLRDDPAKLIPFLNSLARISDAELRCERHRLELQAHEPQAPQNQKAAGLTPKTRQQIENDLNLM